MVNLSSKTGPARAVRARRSFHAQGMQQAPTVPLQVGELLVESDLENAPRRGVSFPPRHRQTSLRSERKPPSQRNLWRTSRRASRTTRLAAWQSTADRDSLRGRAKQTASGKRRRATKGILLGLKLPQSQWFPRIPEFCEQESQTCPRASSRDERSVCNLHARMLATIGDRDMANATVGPTPGLIRPSSCDPWSPSARKPPIAKTTLPCFILTLAKILV